MKRYLILIVFILVILEISNGQITKNDATKLTFEYIKNLNLGECLVYLKQEVVNQNFEIKTFDKSINSMTDQSYAFFIDKFPLKNWAHPCFYLFVNLKNGSIQMIEWKLPPNDLRDWELLTEIRERAPVKLFDFKKNKIEQKKTTQSSDNCYAIIISGGYDSYNNWQRYWNDCSAIYSTLVDLYNFQDSHIKCLISDGTNSGQDRHVNGGYDSSPLDLDGDQDNDIDYSATKANITTVFNSLSSILTNHDHLFIFVTDHGDQESGQDALIYLWGETIRDDQFATEVNKINAGQITIVMGQCYSGGFIDDLTMPNRIISTACDYDETSCGMDYYSYDEFVFHWISAVAGEDPYENPVDADDNNDGFVSMLEAFSYAEANDGCNETPQYFSVQDIGYFLGLGFSLYISGPSYVCSSGTEFTVDNLASSNSITWSPTENITRVSEQGSNPCEFQPYEEGEYGSIDATITYNGDEYEYSLGQENVWLGTPSMPSNVGFRRAGGTCYWEAFISSVPGAESYDWSEDNVNWTLDWSTSYGLFDPYTAVTVYVRARNSCGVSATKSKTKTMGPPAPGCMWKSGHIIPDTVQSESSTSENIRIYPNPAESQVTITVSDATSFSSASDNKDLYISSVTILDSYGKTRKIKQYGSGLKSVTVNVSDLPKGFYFIRVNNNVAAGTYKFLIQ
jgi:hypothetical protein